MRAFLLLLTVLCASLAHPADPWHADLLVPGHDIWHGRAPVDLTNASDEDLAGFPVEVRVGGEAGMLDIGGQDARAVRVCDAAGAEMLFDLRTPDGMRLEDGPIPAGSRLTVPCTAPAGQTQRLYVYFGNPDAYFVPDYLAGGLGAVNGGFESGQGRVPDEWRFGNGDAEHTMAWVEERPRSGGRCVKMTAAEGAEPRWATVQQIDLAVLPGRRYRIAAWVRGEGVIGQAGWYVHVATPESPQAVSRVESAGDGTFDWREVTIEFTAPEDATSLSHGTILYGAGAAWFDDATLTCLDDGAAVGVTVGEVERLELRRIESDGGYLRIGDSAWRHRAPLYVVNVGEASRDVLVRTPFARLRARLSRGFNPDSLRLVDPATGQILPHLIIGDELLLSGDVPARCIKALYAYFDRDPDMAPRQTVGYAELVKSAANLARDPSFQQGDGQPAEWEPMAEGLEQPTALLERVEGGRLGDRCLRLTVSPDAAGRWTGWQQVVNVEPGAEYVFMAYVRTEDVTDGKVRIHAHEHGPEFAEPLRMWSGGPDLTGTTDWRLLSTVIRTSAETRKLVLFLTMNAAGTVYHDGVLLARTMPGTVGELQHRSESDAPPLRVWTENPIVKVFRDTPPPPTPESVELVAARGEEECVQVCLRATRDRESVAIEVDAPRSGEARLAQPRIERVGYVPCFEPSGFFSSKAPAWERKRTPGRERSDGWRGWWPDYLAPIGGTIDLQANRTQPILITFAIPRDARPGSYRSMVRVSSPGADAAEIPVTLRVGRFRLPQRPTLTALFDLRNGPGWSLYDTPERFEQWWRFMAQHRICADFIRPEPVFRLVDGRVTMETTEFDRAAEFYFGELHMAAAYFPHIFYSLGWGHPPRPFLGLEYPTPEYQDAYKQAVRLFWEHVKERGWADRFSLYVSDEPHYQRPEVVESLAEVIGLTREVDPQIPVYSSTWGHEPAWDGVLNHWGIAQYGKFPLDVLNERLADGDKIWYTTDGQFVLDTPYNACERLLPYYCFAHEVSGYEFWALPWYTYDPFRFGWYGYLYHDFAPGETSWTRYPNGSGHLAYPGELIGLDGPLSTIRLEQAREGIEDYEVLIALKRLAEERPELKAEIDSVLEEARSLVPIPNAGGYRSTEILPDPDAVSRVRGRAFELLEQLGGD